MTKKTCILHANCQGEPLLQRLLTCPEFAAQYDVRLFTNYIREPIPDELLARCDLLLYQFLGPKWDTLASKTLLDKLPATARALCIPNMFFKGYWPTWSGKPGFDYRCVLLDGYLALDLPAEETVMLYLRSDVGAKYDLDAITAQSMEREQAKQARTPVQYMDYFLEHYRDVKLFNTVNHPRKPLMDLAASRLLDLLGFTPNKAAIDAMPEPFPEFEQPIHPKVGAYFGWDFAGPDTLYPVYGRPLSFARYAAQYVSARKAGVTDFIGYLQGDVAG